MPKNEETPLLVAVDAPRRNGAEVCTSASEQEDGEQKRLEIDCLGSHVDKIDLDQFRSGDDSDFCPLYCRTWQVLSFIMSYSHTSISQHSISYPKNTVIRVAYPM